MKDSYEQRIQNQFGAFCVRVLKNEARYIQRELASLQSQEKSFGELTASELEQTAVWDKHFMGEHVFEVLGLPVVVAGDLLADALAQLPEGKRDVTSGPWSRTGCASTFRGTPPSSWAIPV